MNIKVNLISKGRKSPKSKSFVIKSVVAVFAFVCAVFLYTAGYVTYMTYFLNSEINKVNLDAIAISGEIRANNEDVNKFVLSKSILDYSAKLDSARFNYKKYLDEIVAVLPPNIILRGVDFQVKGWVSVIVFIPNLETLNVFENRITDQTILDQTVFTTVFSESIVKEKSGGYVVRLQFELKKNV